MIFGGDSQRGSSEPGEQSGGHRGSIKPGVQKNPSTSSTLTGSGLVTVRTFSGHRGSDDPT